MISLMLANTSSFTILCLFSTNPSNKIKIFGLLKKKHLTFLFIILSEDQHFFIDNI